MPYTAYGTEYQDLGTHDASEYASAASNQAQQPQHAAPSGGSPSGGGRQQRPVTMNQNTVGAVTSDGQVIQNPGYTPDAKRQDAFDNYARACMRKNAEASRQQYFDTIRANESLQNDQFKRGVDEVNQRGFNLYGVMQDIDKAGGKDLSPEQGRMLEAATTDFGKQVAKNYGWQFNGAEYDWDKGTFTFQFQNDKGQIGTKTMSRDALNAQMIKAGYIDDPVEVRKRELEAQEKQQEVAARDAKWAAELGLKSEEMNRKFAAMGQENMIKSLEVLSKFQGEDGNLTEAGKWVAQRLFEGFGEQGGVNQKAGQQGADQQGGGQPYSGAAAAFANAPGSTVSTNSEYAQRGRELNDARKAQDAKIKAEKDAKRVAKEAGATGASFEGESAADSTASGRVSKFGGGVREMSAAEQKDSEELSDLRRRKDNGTLTPGGLARLKELEGKEPLTDAERASMKKAGYGAEAADERRRVAAEMSRRNQEEASLVKPRSLRSDKGASNGEMSEENRFNALHSGEGEALPGEERRATNNGPAAEGLEEMSDEDIARLERNAEGRRREAEETAAYEARGESYRSQFADGPSESQLRDMEEERSGGEGAQNDEGFGGGGVDVNALSEMEAERYDKKRKFEKASAGLDAALKEEGARRDRERNERIERETAEAEPRRRTSSVEEVGNAFERADRWLEEAQHYNGNNNAIVAAARIPGRIVAEGVRARKAGEEAKTAELDAAAAERRSANEIRRVKQKAAQGFDLSKEEQAIMDAEKRKANRRVDEEAKRREPQRLAEAEKKSLVAAEKVKRNKEQDSAKAVRDMDKGGDGARDAIKMAFAVADDPNAETRAYRANKSVAKEKIERMHDELINNGGALFKKKYGISGDEFNRMYGKYSMAESDVGKARSKSVAPKLRN